MLFNSIDFLIFFPVVLQQEFLRYGLAITKQNMANWMIRLGEEYLSVMYDYLHQKLYEYHVIQADEPPCW